ncbi:hypothetical protein FACS189443_4900 [Planctomycetales bacterium]|nr:hypothetical protein FACS189443_4900 [Planctomycetales bacterium]
MIWLLAGYMWLYVHRPFEIWTWLGTLRVERVYMLLTLAAWLMSGKTEVTKNPMNFAVMLFIAAATIATMLSNTTNIFVDMGWQDFMKVGAFYLLLITCVKTEKDLKIIVTVLMVVFFIFIAHSYREYLNGNIDYAAGAARLIGVGVTYSEFNDFGTWIPIMMPLAYPFLTLCKKRWHYLFAVAFILLSLRCVQLTGSRGAFISVCALFVLPVLLSKYRFRILPVILIVAPVVWFSMPESMQNRYRTIWDPTISEQANANARGRTAGFYDGMKNFGNSPLYGVGMGQHGPALGQQFQAHNLPGQIAGETGLLGIAGFMSILGCFVFNHWRVLQDFKRLKEAGRVKEGLYPYRVSTALMYCVLMSLLQGLSLHNGYRFYWIWFGGIQAAALFVIDQQVAKLQRSGY